MLTKALAAAAISAALAGIAAAPANADVQLPPRGTGSAGVDAGSSVLEAGSAVFVTPIPSMLGRLLCAVDSGSAICHWNVDL
ncbi:hypothetical protein [Nocardia tengchongensis]|uniref:hypothetical protein n=1 Tax=Nocardia tengchongensis TaxID=2055889 RepID=UPI003690A9C5